jgi:hypothetical protein
VALWQRGKSWYYDFRHRGKRYVGCIGPVSGTVARQRYARLRVDAAEGTLGAKAKREDVLFKDLAARYLTHQQPLWRPKTHYAITSVVGLLVKQFGELHISQIDHATVERYKRDKLEAGRKASTVLKDLTSFQAIFHWAIEQGITTVNP